MITEGNDVDRPKEEWNEMNTHQDEEEIVTAEGMDMSDPNENDTESNDTKVPTEQETFANEFLPSSAQALYNELQTSQDKLFFVQYIPAGTVRARWYLVQIDYDLSTIDPVCSESKGIYQCSFLARHSKDQNKSHAFLN